jgi:PAP2 superfamily
MTRLTLHSAYLAFCTIILLSLAACNRTETSINEPVASENLRIQTQNGEFITLPADNEAISVRTTDPATTANRTYGFGAAGYSGDIVIKWHELFAEIDRYAAGYRPVPAPRALGYINLAAYESAVAGMPNYQSLAKKAFNVALPPIESSKFYYWTACVNSAYYTSIKLFFPNINSDLKAKIERLYATNNQAMTALASASVLTRSQKLGEDIANAIYRWSATDVAGHNAYLNPQPADYQRAVGSFLWQPTPPLYGWAAFPYWGKVRAFAITSREKLALPPSHYIGEFSNTVGSPYYKELKEVYDRTNAVKSNTSAGIFKDDKWIAEFWSDDNGGETMSPPCRLVSIANQLARKENLNLEKTLLLYAKMGISLADAGVAIWNSKYTYNTERPITGIRRLFDPNWLSALNNSVTGAQGITPPFPGYPSGHSGFGAAGGVVLAHVFGENYTFTDNTHLGRTEFIGTPRTFTSFKAMAQEDAISRIPLGVHVRMDCTEGVRLGEVVARKVLALPWRR